MVEMHIPPGLYQIGKNIPRIILKPKETLHITINFIKGLWRYYISKDKKHNFVVNKRITKHTIYPNGTLLIDSLYSITMIDAGNFKLEKGYRTENKEKNANHKYKINFRGAIKQVYTKLDCNVTENRFSDFLLVVELSSHLKNGSKFIPQITKESRDVVKYEILYTNLKIFENFEFSVIQTIPGEFDRANKYDTIHIEPIYGLYEFHSKIDRQSKDCEFFAPVIQEEKQKSQYMPSPENSLFYSGNSWKIYSPAKSVIKFANITDK